MRRALVAAVCTALLAVMLPQIPATADEPSLEETLASAAPYRSDWSETERDIASLTDFAARLGELREQYAGWLAVLETEQGQLDRRIEDLTSRVNSLDEQEASLAEDLRVAQELQATLQQQVGGLARLLYQQPAPDLSAVAQLLEGEDLRAFERQNLVTSVLTSKGSALEQVSAQVVDLGERLAEVRRQRAEASADLERTEEARSTVAGQREVVVESLAQIDADEGRAEAAIEEIRQAEQEALRRAAAAAAAAERAAAERAAAAAPAQQPSTGLPAVPAAPAGGSAQAQGLGEFSALLPAEVPYRQTFLTYGLKYRVEPALLAAIARQESGFNPYAGCSRSGGGKGIMQHENQPRYCGAVAASVERAASMLAGYYNRSGSWTAAVFAYNNGPGLMDEWVRYSSNPDRLLAVLADYYNRQPYASPGPRGGYATWGAWRAAIAYSYAAPRPLPGFHSVTQKWLIYRLG